MTHVPTARRGKRPGRRRGARVRRCGGGHDRAAGRAPQCAGSVVPVYSWHTAPLCANRRPRTWFSPRMDERSENIFLVGPMGAGKTTVGRQLAKTLGKEFIDCDNALEDRTGAPSRSSSSSRARRLPQARTHGARRAHAGADIVLATGGGAVLDRGEPRRGCAAAASRSISRRPSICWSSAPRATAPGRCCPRRRIRAHDMQS